MVGTELDKRKSLSHLVVVHAGLNETIAYAIFMCLSARNVWKKAALWERIREARNEDPRGMITLTVLEILKEEV